MPRFASPIMKAALLLPLVGCFDDETRLPVDSAKLVSASGVFTTTQGQLDVAVSPRDADGKFLGMELPKSAFSFANVTIKRQGTSGSGLPVDTAVSGIEVRQPKQGQALTGVVVFDSSGSMSSNDPGKLGRKQGGQAVFQLVGENDALAVLDFGAGKDSELSSSRLLQDFTSDQALLRSSLDELRDAGGTPLYSSLLDALSVLSGKTPTGGSIIVLTDGEASESTPTVDEVIAEAKAQQVSVYAIGLGQQLSFEELQRLGSETGGGFATSQEAAGLADTFEGIGTGVSAGRVIVHGIGSYDALTVGALYEVNGELVTNDPEGAQVTTPFAFLVRATRDGVQSVRVLAPPNQ